MTSNKSGVHPVGDRILIKVEEIPEKTEGGIIIADQAREQHGQAQMAGELVQHGPDAWSDYPNGAFAKVGDRVMFAKYHGINITGKDGEKYRVMNDEDITAIIEKGVILNDVQSRKGFK